MNTTASQHLLKCEQDQIIQEVYLEAFKNHVKHTIEPEYIITDDNLRFYKAWTKVMNHSPKRLIHSWHVINCWNFKGKELIQNRGIMSEMKYKLKKIMTACNQEDFTTLKNAYFEKLEQQNQTMFLKYLQKEYFFNEDHIKLWAYYHRMHAGINKIIALERCLGVYKRSLIRKARRTSAEALLDSWETYDKMCSLAEPEEIKVLPNIHFFDVTIKSEDDQEEQVLLENDKWVETKEEIKHNADPCHVTIKSEPVIENESLAKKFTDEPSTNEKEMEKKTQDFIEFSSMVGETEFFLQNEFLELGDTDRKVVLRSFALFLEENVKCNFAKRKTDDLMRSQSTKKSKSVLEDE
ncbi:hypothetical protein FQR65_LT02338 [Abscondita terminalis]|nr:hypothetical protein FQR65_LT02338 [Abscondita terminalis]